MDKQQKHTLQTFRRVRDFLRRNGVAIRFAKLDAQLDALAGVVDRLTGYSVEQDTRTRLAKSGMRRSPVRCARYAWSSWSPSHASGAHSRPTTVRCGAR